MITHLCITSVSKYIHPITTWAAYQVARNLRPDDRSELSEGHGHDPVRALIQASTLEGSVYFTVPSGEVAGVAGVGQSGDIWMLCTPAIEKYPVTFAREAKRYVEGRTEKLLWNIADKRNTVHLKLLRFLGFKFLRELDYGPNNLPFIEFCRVQSSSSRRS